MLILLSPAKTLDFEPQNLTETFTKPTLIQDTKILVNELQKYSATDISELMHVSEKIAELNFNRYQNFTFPFNKKNAKQALLTFKGDVYRPLEIETYGEKEFELAQKQVRILSGLYGVLKALDLMQEYRLEMGTKLQNERGKDLYEFWGEKITNQLNADIAEQNETEILNLASIEYFKSIKKKNLTVPVTNVKFLQKRDGKLKNIAIIAKRMRGVMTNYILKKGITRIQDIHNFTVEGYKLHKRESTEFELVFVK